MPPFCCSCGTARPDTARSAAVVNAAIRQLSAGRDRPGDWDAAALAKLARLRAEWRAAVAAEERGAA
jgi:hypothetical protein